MLMWKSQPKLSNVNVAIRQMEMSEMRVGICLMYHVPLQLICLICNEKILYNNYFLSSNTISTKTMAI